MFQNDWKSLITLSQQENKGIYQTEGRTGRYNKKQREARDAAKAAIVAKPLSGLWLIRYVTMHVQPSKDIKTE